MALAARCPHCGTTFKVVRDQLLLRDGWVRCGHCGEPFNAHQHLIDQAPAAAAVAPEPVVDSGEQPAQPAAGMVLTAPADAPAETPPAEIESLTAAASAAPEGDMPAAPARPPSSVADRAFPPPPLPPAVAAEPLLPSHPAPPTPWAETAAPGPQDEHDLRDTEAGPPSAFDLGEALNYQFDTAGGAEPLPIGSDAVPPAAAEPGFLRRARRDAAWRSRPVRIALALGSLALALTLALQAALFWRDPLAQTWPASRPALQRLCNLTTGCSVAAPRNVDALVIDSSALNPSGSGLVLTVLLRNRTDRAVAYPALDLTLTDLQGRIDVRKVVGPAQYLAPPLSTPESVAAGLPGGRQIQVQLRLRTQGAAPAGYRVSVFYP